MYGVEGLCTGTRKRNERRRSLTRVELQDVSVRYGSVWAVRDVSLEIQPGEIFFLLGPSG